MKCKHTSLLALERAVLVFVLVANKAINCDTDSLFFIQMESEPRLVKCGDNLGDVSDELKPGEYIDEFVSGGPDNYAYRFRGRGNLKQS